MDAALTKYIREIAANDFLFQQGDPGNTMFVILAGSVAIIEKGKKGERTISTLGPGEMFGEKALLKEGVIYRRTFTAQAKSSSSVIEIDNQNLKLILAKIPDFMIKMLRMLADRLDKANEMIRILQPLETAERLTQFIAHTARFYGKKTAQGIEMTLSVDEIFQAIAVPKEAIEKGINELVQQKIIVKNAAGFTLADENALFASAPLLKERLAA